MARTTTMTMKALVLATVLLSGAFAGGEDRVLRDVAYADAHAAQRLDVYLAKSTKPAPVMVFIHGGGWRAGSKKHVPAFLRKANAEGWLAVVSVEYRFTDVTVHPAQVDDCSRAIQFVRQHAQEWNIDPTRIGVTGGSAGGHLAAYMAVRDERADPAAADPVARRSSRVLFAIPFAGPTDWTLLGRVAHGHPAYRQLIGYAPGTPANEMAADRIKDVSPVSFVTPDDPPMLIVHGDADRTVPFEHARALEAALKQAGVAVELDVIQDGTHAVAGAGPAVVARADAYMRERLGGPR